MRILSREQIKAALPYGPLAQAIAKVSMPE